MIRADKCNICPIDHFFPTCLQVTNLVKGEFEDILESFSQTLKFRVQQFKRFDGGWGSFDKETGTVYTLGH